MTIYTHYSDYICYLSLIWKKKSKKNKPNLEDVAKIKTYELVFSKNATGMLLDCFILFALFFDWPFKTSI